MALFPVASLFEQINADSFRVQIPSPVIFLCGGASKPRSRKPQTRRDYFRRVFDSGVLAGSRIILAETAEPLTADAAYSDLLSFESDIAQVVGLILLFAESPGSLAELGAFSAMDTIAPSLLVVMDDYFYAQSSFIKNGPIKFLEQRYGEEFVLALERKHVGIGESGDLKEVDERKFAQAIVGEVQKRLKSREGFTQLDVRNSGHIILMIIGICYFFGGLLISEIKRYLTSLSVPTENTSDIRLKNFIYCAELLGWIAKIKKGNHTYYVSLTEYPNIGFSFVEGFPLADKTRLRAMIMDHWKANDPPRFRGISETRASSMAS